MRRARPWQIVIVVAACIAVGLSIYLALTGDRGAQINSEITLVDPSTGELFRSGGSRGVTIPATNPRTGQAMLIPAIHEGDKWFVNKRYLPSIDRAGAHLDALDRTTGEVRVNAGSPTRLR
jgi:hypothetical protein